MRVGGASTEIEDQPHEPKSLAASDGTALSRAFEADKVAGEVNMMRLTGIAVAAAAWTLSACASSPGASSPGDSCAVDLARVVPWERAPGLTMMRVPFAMEHRGCGKTLVYVGAEHTNDPQSTTFRLIEAVFKSRPVEFVVIEGVQASEGVNPGWNSPRGLLSAAKQAVRQKNDSEPFLAIRLADAAHAKVIGGEPEETEILAALSAHGFRAEDMFGFYVLRLVRQWQREGSISSPIDPALDGQIHKLERWFVRSARVDADDLSRVNSYEGFKAWYQATNEISYEQGFREDGGDAAPAHQVRPVRKTNVISDIVTNTREKSIVSTIADAVRDYDSVVVVYGASHYMADSPAIAAAFGPPRELELGLK